MTIFTRDIAVAALILVFNFAACATERADIIVAKDGTGNFTTIQDAIKSIPLTNAANVTILVKKGTYIEHVFIDRSFISIVGEDRDSTIIEFELDRAVWNTAYKSNSGSGVIDIGVSTADSVSTLAVTDIVIGNCTVINTVANKDLYTHVIRGEATCTNIFVVHCNVWCTGKDTIALWNTTEGRYYHSDCSFKGSIDAVCPRGWCYAVACDFYEVYASAPIWHEGAVGTSQKFVIRNANVKPVGTNTFRLLNHQKEAEFYLLDCLFSSKIEEQGSTAPAYYYNCHGDSGDQTWYDDNLSDTVTQNQITASWAFDNVWDPENIMPAVLPFSSLPQPWNKAYDISPNVELKWINGRNADTNAVYFGSSNPPQFIHLQSGRTYSPGQLEAGTYYWRIDAISKTDTIKGNVWTFTVGNNVSQTVVKTEKNNPEDMFSVMQKDNMLTFYYSLKTSAMVSIRIFNLMGRNVSTIPAKRKNAGTHTLQWNINSHKLSKGAYLAYFEADRNIQSTKIIIK